ncbi:hypothetical protein OL548_08135 [Lysinibacillus sp. MHQ-1]|nr:hypothetical protein OL548_08135 [Lysinibacillus sp. MHQ-1]
MDKEAEQQEQFDETLIIAALQEADEEETGNSQRIIARVVEVEAQQINDSPCLEFILYDKEQDILFVRVWNMLLNQWDRHLEQQLTDKEQLMWREQYL